MPDLQENGYGFADRSFGVATGAASPKAVCRGKLEGSMIRALLGAEMDASAYQAANLAPPQKRGFAAV
jgi:hypothetical protein